MSLSLNRDLQLLVTAIPEPQGYRVFLIDGSKCDLLHCHKGKKIFLIGCVLRCLVGYIVLQDSQKQLLMCDLEKDKIIQRRVYKSEILAVKMTRKNIVILMHDQIFIHNNIEDITKGRYMDIPRNATGIGALAEEAPYFAYPWYTNSEDKSVNTLSSVRIIDVSEEGNGSVITTIYQNGMPNIAAIVFNKTGKLIAIANTEGKLIRVFEASSGQMITEFHRGLTEAAIDLLYFSECDKYLVSTSNSKTVHIFQLNQDPQDSSITQRLVEMLPEKAQERATEFLKPKSSFAKAYLILELGGTGSVCGIKRVRNQTRLLVATPSGHFHVFILPEEKGDCEHHETFDLRFRAKKKTELYNFPPLELIQIDDSTKTEGLMARAAASVSKFAARATTCVAAASASTSSALNLGASALASNAGASRARASASNAGASASNAGASASNAGTSASRAGASTTATASTTSGCSDSSAAAAPANVSTSARQSLTSALTLISTGGDSAKSTGTSISAKAASASTAGSATYAVADAAIYASDAEEETNL